MPTLDRIELRDSTRQAVVLPDLVGLLEAVEVDERLLEEGEVRLVLLSGTDAQAADTLQPGQVVRAVYAPGSVPLVEEWRLYGAEREYGERASTEARARPLWWDLAGRAATKTLPGTGAVRGAWTIYRRAPAAALSEIMAAAAPTFLAGTTSGLSAEQAAARVSLQVAGHTVLEALRMLCENLACEWSLRYESAEDQYYIDLVEEVQAAGAASSRPLRASAAAISNRLRLTRRTDTGEYWSRLYARLEGEGAASGAVGGGSAGGSVGLGEASFEVEAASGSAPSVTLALPAGVVPYDGWGTAGGGREQVFAGTDSAGFFQITASEAAPAGGGSPGSSTVTLGGGAFAAGDRIRFATDAAGTWLTFIEIESPQYGRVDRVEAIPGSPFENLLERAGVSQDLSAWSGSPLMPEGFQALGAATITQEASEIHVRHGDYAAKVTAAADEGIETLPVEIDPSMPYLFAWSALSVEAGGVRMELIDADGVSHPAGSDPAYTTELNAVGLAAGAAENFASPVRLRWTALQDGTVYYLDAATLVPSGTEARALSSVMGPQDLWLKAAGQARSEGGAAYYDVEASFVDLGEILPGSYESAQLGALVEITDGEDPVTSAPSLAFTTRIVRLRRRLIRGATGGGSSGATWQKEAVLERRRTDIVDALSEARRAALRTERQPDRKSPPPRLVARRTDGAQAATFDLSVHLASPSGPQPSSYLIRLDHTLSGTTWTPTADGAFADFETEADAGAGGLHSVTVERPAAGEEPVRIRAYAFDRGALKGSEVVLLEVHPARITVEAIPNQADSEGLMDLLVEDPLLAVTTIEYATRVGGAAAWGPWTAEPASPAPGEQGTIGTDASLLRGFKVALAAEHNSQIRWRILGQTAAGAGFVFETGSHTFDLDLLPNLRVLTPTWGPYDEANDRFELILAYTADEDANGLRAAARTSSAYASSVSNSALTLAASGRSGTRATGVYAAPGQTTYFAAKAIFEDAGGDLWQTEATVGEVSAPVLGPEGPAGPSGPTGPQGPEGPEGPAGSTVGAIYQHFGTEDPGAEPGDPNYLGEVSGFDFLWWSTNQKLYEWNAGLATWQIVYARVVAQDVIAATLSAIVANLGSVFVNADGGLEIQHRSDSDLFEDVFRIVDTRYSGAASRLFDLMVVSVAGLDSIQLGSDADYMIRLFSDSARVDVNALRSGRVDLVAKDADIQLDPGGATGRIDIKSAQTDFTASSGNGTLPADPEGFIRVKVNGAERKIPYYLV